MTTIDDFMQREYSISPSPKSKEILRRVGFKHCPTREEQIENLMDIQKRIRINDQDGLVAKIFSLAYKYDDILIKFDDKFVREWSCWLGCAEYKLARRKKDPSIKKKLFAKTIDHLLISRDNGNVHPQNASILAAAYYELENYKEALPFLLEARERGVKNKYHASLIGNCYFKLGMYKKALSEYLYTINLAKKEKFDNNWMIALDHKFKNSFDVLVASKNSIPKQEYIDMLKEFKEFYGNFVEYWKQNKSARTHFRLLYGKENKIDIALAEVS